MLQLRPYQEAGVDFLAAHKRALLADEMRLGKTPQAIRAAQRVGAERILTVCPAIAVRQWERQWQAWWDQSKSALVPKVTVMSYDKARNYADELAAKPWDVFVVDESHFAKNPEAKRTKMVFGKDQIGWSSDYIWALSGTPAPKHAGELWVMLRAFGVVGMHYSEFCGRYCRLNHDGEPVGTREEMIPELKALLAKCMLRRKRREVAPEMDDIGYDFLYVDPQFTVSEQVLAPVDVRMLQGEELLAWLEKHADSEHQFRIAVANAKVPALVDEIAFAIENELLPQTVFFGFHIEPLQKAAQLLREKGISVDLLYGATSTKERERIQDDFRRGKLSVVGANIITAGTAIDLSAARHGYFLELDWVPGNNVQAANRLINMDKPDPVTIDVVSWPGSTDDRIQGTLLTRVRELSKLL